MRRRIPLTGLEWFLVAMGLPLCTFGLGALGSVAYVRIGHIEEPIRTLHLITFWPPALWAAFGVVVSLQVALVVQRGAWRMKPRPRYTNATPSAGLVVMAFAVAVLATAGHLLQASAILGSFNQSPRSFSPWLLVAFVPVWAAACGVLGASLSSLWKSRRGAGASAELEA